jgi:hypothetical protein
VAIGAAGRPDAPVVPVATSTSSASQAVPLSTPPGPRLLTNAAVVLERLAVVAGVWGQTERAARLFGAAIALREAIDAPLWPIERIDYDRHVAAARSSLGEEPFAAAWAEGRTMRLEDAIALALDEA